MMSFLFVIATMVLIPAFTGVLYGMDRRNETLHRPPPSKLREVYRWNDGRRYPERFLTRRRFNHA